MLSLEFDPKDLKSLEQAIKRNPQTVIREVGVFLARAIASYNRGILRNPWRVGMAGGGAPVATGNLRDTHKKSVSSMSAEIYPNARYAEAVHANRPWLDHVFNQQASDIRQLEEQLLEKVTEDLAR